MYVFLHFSIDFTPIYDDTLFLDTYLISLPQNLPPTFKGRALKFSYQFNVGVCRASSSHPQAGSSTSRVMKIPIRIYNHTSGK